MNDDDKDNEDYDDDDDQFINFMEFEEMYDTSIEDPKMYDAREDSKRSPTNDCNDGVEYSVGCHGSLDH